MLLGQLQPPRGRSGQRRMGVPRKYTTMAWDMDDPSSFDLTTLALGSHGFDHHYRHPLGDLATTTTTKEEKTCLRSTTNMQTQVCAQSDTRKQIPRRSRRFSNHREKATARTTEHQRHRRCRHTSSSPHSTCHRIPTAQTPPATTTH